MEKRDKLALLAEIHAVATELLRVTALLELNEGTEAQEKSVSDFHFLMEKREPMFEKIALLQKACDESADESPAGACERQRQATKDVLAQIVALDRAHLAAMLRINAAVKSAIKGINSGKKLSRVYAHPLEREKVSGLLDTKK